LSSLIFWYTYIFEIIFPTTWKRAQSFTLIDLYLVFLNSCKNVFHNLQTFFYIVHILHCYVFTFLSETLVRHFLLFILSGIFFHGFTRKWIDRHLLLVLVLKPKSFKHAHLRTSIKYWTQLVYSLLTIIIIFFFYMISNFYWELIRLKIDI